MVFDEFSLQEYRGSDITTLFNQKINLIIFHFSKINHYLAVEIYPPEERHRYFYHAVTIRIFL